MCHPLTQQCPDIRYGNFVNDNPSLPIRGKEYDHPEHYRDRILRHCSESRYIPEQLQDLLLEQCGHKCSVCREPSYEIHHIEPIEYGGTTAYENLIVLCPNCHTRVHREDIPSKKQLRHYKLKEEVSYGLPIIGYLSSQEKAFIKKLSEQPEEELVLFIERHHEEIMVEGHENARKILRKNVGLLYLESEGIIRTEYDFCCGLAEGGRSVSLLLRVTGKGIRWLRYLKKVERLELLGC
jgi:HNH endonuclease